ncbi:unnamed protein product [Didymodactylos carnosus]|uniref:Uncharacterized protein n=1 Tax=Didymodactylos carnosus TaxID=1234261 RepID=A0A814SXX4_9BILA|nr:unnamed protein product [Didymodactylos carnosus]CAF1153995.1 unnamed protein product [Didymodactylos carnosus]CAF3736089.1 unnamed protein product [Didymodactylos carnosus]CAF3917446.1 unnamed protein product [Didymodactylos carnosus]
MEYRSQHDRSRTIYNRYAYEQQMRTQQAEFQNRMDQNAWPGLDTIPTTSNSTTIHELNLNVTIKALSDELKEAKQRHEQQQKRIEDKFKSNMIMMNQACMLMQQSQQTKQTMILAMSVTISQTMFSTCTKEYKSTFSCSKDKVPHEQQQF